MKFNFESMLVLCARVSYTAFLGLLYYLMAQGKVRAEEIQPLDLNIQSSAQICLVALGPKPSRRYQKSGGGEDAIMLLPQPGEIPPAKLYYKSIAFTEKEPHWKTLKLSFNTPSGMQNIAPDIELTLYQKIKGTDEYIKYIVIPPGIAESQRVIFLVPSIIKKKPWSEPPLVRLIHLDKKTLEDKRLLLKNLSQITILHAFRDSLATVPSMKSVSYPFSKSGRLCRLEARYGEPQTIIYNTAIKMGVDGGLQIFVFYDINPETNSGKSVGVFRMMLPVGKAGNGVERVEKN